MSFDFTKASISCVNLHLKKALLPWRSWVVLAAAFLLYGCATPKSMAPYTLGSSGGHVVHGRAGDAQISAEIVNNSQTLRDYFGVSSPSWGVLTVFVKVENTGVTDSLLVDKTDMQLLGQPKPQGELEDPLKKRGDVLDSGRFAKQVVGNTIAMSIFAGPAFAPFAVLGAMDAAHKEKSSLEYNFMRWEYRTTTLAPAQSMEGFVYFGGDVASLPANSHLMVTVHDLSNRSTKTTDILLQK